MNTTETTEKKAQKQDQTPEPPQHPLLAIKPRQHRSFEEWLAAWNVAGDQMGTRLGLLHEVTTNQNCWIPYRMVRFLLDIADGHRDGGVLTSREENARLDRSEYPELRQAIARKAFSVLYLKFFRCEKEGSRTYPLWWSILHNDELCRKVLHFFRPESNGLRNLGRAAWRQNEHEREAVIGFLRSFCRLGWDTREFYELLNDVDDGVRKRLAALRPKFVEVLNELGELRWLVEDTARELDTASLAKLKEIAFRKDLFFPHENITQSTNRRRPRTLREAVLGGSEAAAVLLIYGVRKGERRKFHARYAKSHRESEA